MIVNATFNNILVISLRSVLLVEETGVPEENHPPAASHLQTLSHNVVSSTPRLSGIPRPVVLTQDTYKLSMISFKCMCLTHHVFSIPVISWPPYLPTISNTAQASYEPYMLAQSEYHRLISVVILRGFSKQGSQNNSTLPHTCVFYMHSLLIQLSV